MIIVNLGSRKPPLISLAIAGGRSAGEATNSATDNSELENQLRANSARWNNR